MRIRAGSGLGDGIYLRCLADEFVRRGKPVTALCNYPDLFIGSQAKVEPFSRNPCDVVGHYVNGKGNPETSQWEDCCKAAGVEAPLRIEWEIRNTKMVERVKEKAAGRPIILVHGGRTPMGRTDGFGMELLPEKSAFDTVLNALKDCYLLRFGRGDQIYPLDVSDDLNGQTTVSDLLDLGASCDAVVCQCSFAIPLAEVFDKPLLVIWSRRTQSSNKPYVQQITPTKVISGDGDVVIDDWAPELLHMAARGLFH